MVMYDSTDFTYLPIDGKVDSMKRNVTIRSDNPVSSDTDTLDQGK